MLDFIKKRLYDLDRVAGLELVLTKEGFVGQLVVLEKEKGQLSILKKASNISDIQTISEYLDSEIPIVLSIDGKGVLHREMGGEEQDSSAILQRIFPNASLEHFFLQQRPMVNGQIVSLIRRNILQEVLEAFEAQHITILGLHLGPFTMVEALVVLDNTTDFQASTGRLIFQDQRLKQYSAGAGTNPDLNIGGEMLEGALGVAFANAFKGMIAPTVSASPEIEASRDEFFQKKRFKVFGISVLVGLLALLLVNSVLFQHFYAQNANLETDLMVNRNYLEELDSLKAKHQYNQKLATQYRVHQSSKASFYADRLAASISEGITFTDVEIFPLIKDKKSSTTTPLQFDGKTIRIKGKASNCLVINQWNRKLEEMDWVQETKILHCGFDDGGNGVFELEVGL